VLPPAFLCAMEVVLRENQATMEVIFTSV